MSSAGTPLRGESALPHRAAPNHTKRRFPTPRRSRILETEGTNASEQPQDNRGTNFNQAKASSTLKCTGSDEANPSTAIGRSKARHRPATAKGTPTDAASNRIVSTRALQNVTADASKTSAGDDRRTSSRAANRPVTARSRSPAAATTVASAVVVTSKIVRVRGAGMSIARASLAKTRETGPAARQPGGGCGIEARRLQVEPLATHPTTDAKPIHGGTGPESSPARPGTHGRTPIPTGSRPGWRQKPPSSRTWTAAGPPPSSGPG